MIILYPDKSLRAPDLFHHGFGEFLININVMLPIFLLKNWALKGHVAKRPKGIIGISIIIPLFFRLCQPYPFKGISRVINRDFDIVVTVRDPVVCLPAAGSYP